jgi:hypothetical protein
MCRLKWYNVVGAFLSGLEIDCCLCQHEVHDKTKCFNPGLVIAALRAPCRAHSRKAVLATSLAWHLIAEFREEGIKLRGRVGPGKPVRVFLGR